MQTGTSGLQGAPLAGPEKICTDQSQLGESAAGDHMFNRRPGAHDADKRDLDSEQQSRNGEKGHSTGIVGSFCGGGRSGTQQL